MGSVEINPEATRKDGLLLSAAAAELEARASAALGELAALMASRPQGSDETGDAYDTSLQTDRGPLPDLVDGQTKELVHEGTTIGETLTAAATDYEVEDLRASAQIRQHV